MFTKILCCPSFLLPWDKYCQKLEYRYHVCGVEFMGLIVRYHGCVNDCLHSCILFIYFFCCCLWLFFFLLILIVYFFTSQRNGQAKAPPGLGTVSGGLCRLRSDTHQQISRGEVSLGRWRSKPDAESHTDVQWIAEMGGPRGEEGKVPNFLIFLKILTFSNILPLCGFFFNFYFQSYGLYTRTWSLHWEGSPTYILLLS